MRFWRNYCLIQRVFFFFCGGGGGGGGGAGGWFVALHFSLFVLFFRTKIMQFSITAEPVMNKLQAKSFSKFCPLNCVYMSFESAFRGNGYTFWRSNSVNPLKTE